MLSARLVLVLVAVLATLVAACGGASSGGAVTQASPAEAVEMLDSRVVIDVRSPEEFAAASSRAERISPPSIEERSRSRGRSSWSG